LPESKAVFFEKRTQKLLDPGPSLSGKNEAKFAKVFCFFFPKKKALRPFPSISKKRSVNRPRAIMRRRTQGRVRQAGANGGGSSNR
jgi:hypothetical protein